MAVSLLPAAPVLAADHRDGASVEIDAATDVNDVYAWVDAGGQSVYLAMTVFPAAPRTGAQFSNSAYYVLHTTSRATAASTTSTPLDITCGFDNNATQRISCWFGDSTNFIYGDASPATGLTANNITVYAGTRKDHFFFNLAGYNQVRANVRGATAAQLALNADGCPTNVATMTAQLTQLRTAPGGGAPQDFFLPLNTLAIVFKVPVTLLNKGGPILSVWGATYRKG